jgi:hypothetical protein
MSWHFLWVELCYQVNQVKGLAECLVFVEGCRAWYVDSRNEREAAALGFESSSLNLEVEISGAEFERRHGSAGWFENDKPAFRMTRFQRFMLWLGFELE